MSQSDVPVLIIFPERSGNSEFTSTPLVICSMFSLLAQYLIDKHLRIFNKKTTSPFHIVLNICLGNTFNISNSLKTSQIMAEQLSSSSH